VGELLHGADREARSVLWDVGSLDAVGLAVGWADFASASAAALAAIPHPGLSTALVSVKLDSHAKAVGRLALPEAMADRRLERATALTWRAHALLSANATPAATLDEARRRDADAARLRIVQTVYVAAHGVSLALREATKDAEPLARLKALGRQVDAMERVTGSYVQRHASAFAGEHPTHPEAGSLAEALTQWNLTAHQALEHQDVSTADVVGIARTNAGLMLSATVIISAAAERGIIDRVDSATRLSPGLDAATTAWTALGKDWHDSRLASPKAHANLETLAAGSQLHQALREITRDGSGWASPALIASRTDLAATVRDLAHAATGIADLARRYSSLPGELAREGRLKLPARHLVELEKRAYTGLMGDKASALELPVSPSELAQNRSVRPTPRLVARLEALAQITVARSDASGLALTKSARPLSKLEMARVTKHTAIASLPAQAEPSVGW
jgi:hypothetical protein